MIAALWTLLAFFALLFTAIEFPTWINWLNPYWLILFVTFWFYYRPSGSQLWALFFLTLVFDSLMQMPLGLHGLAVIPYAFLMMRYSNIYKNISPLLQAVIVIVATAWMLGIFQWLYLKDSPFFGSAYNWGMIKLFSTAVSWVILRYDSRAIWGTRIDYYK